MCKMEARVRSLRALSHGREALSGTRNLGAPRAVAGCVCPLRPAVAGASLLCLPSFPAFRRGRREGDRAILRHPPSPPLPALELDTHLNENGKDAVN
jgi:hypothetical protein